MKILKKKSLGVIEVYVVFFGCIFTGYLTYQTIVNSMIN